jgi:serine/threonine-protein kinase
VGRDALIGTDVGGYVIERELGRGGMGVVYAATHPMIGKRAAIKVLNPELSENPGTVERFVQEARSVNQIGHHGIVDIFAFGSLPDGRHYLVMDLLEGEPLRKRVKRGRLHVAEAVQVIDEIAHALMAAHGKGFVHRDLKPDNVFLVAHPGRMDVKLLDFGLAKLMGGVGQRAYRTATGAQVGTPDYMSPEQLRGSGEVDGRCDTYALGVTAFEMLVGERPRRLSGGKFDLDGTPAEEIARVPLVPRELAELVEHMLADSPDERPSLSAVRAVLKRLRPSLPSISVVGLEVQLPRTTGDEPLDLTASAVGARPVLPTPPKATTTVPPPTPPTEPDEPKIPATLRGHAPAQVPVAAPGLARVSSQHPSTTVGVPPPPTAPITRPHPTTAPPPVARPSESRIWLVLGAVLVVAAGVALALVLAR